MSRFKQAHLGWLPLLLAGCNNAEPPALAQPLSERVADEALRLNALLHPINLVAALVVVVAGLLAARWSGAIIHVLWRTGFDQRRKLARWGAIIRLIILSSIGYLLLERVMRAAPILSGAALVLFTAAALVTLRPQLENLAVGVSLLVRRTVRPGDHLIIGNLSGIVRELGLSGLQLRSGDGSTLIVPNRLLNQQAVVVSRDQHTAKVLLRVDFGEPTTGDIHERTRRAVLLCPYRSIGTPVRIRAEGLTSFGIEFQCHGVDLVAEAEAQVRATLSTASKDA